MTCALTLRDYDELRSYAGGAEAIYITGFNPVSNPNNPGIAGWFTRDDVDTTSADNAGTIIVSGVGKRWKRMYDDTVVTSWFGDTGDGSTSDGAAIQASIDFAIDTGNHRVEVIAGVHIIDETIQINGNPNFKALELFGAAGHFLGETELRHHATQKTNPLLNIQGARAVHVHDLMFKGNNVAPATQHSSTWVNGDHTDWVSSGVQEARRAPYAGITIDALAGADPGVGSNYTFDSYGQSLSSQVLIKRCRIENFLVASLVNPASGAVGSENIVYEDCMIVDNKYGLCTCATQQREVVSRNSHYNGHFCQFDNVTFGDRAGPPISVRDGIHGQCYRLLQSSSDVGPLSWKGGYCETVASIGIIGSAASSANCPAVFEGVTFSFIGKDDDNNTTNKDIALKSNVPTTFIDCMFVSQFMQNCVPNKTLNFVQCGFRCEGTATDTTPGEAENFFVTTAQSLEHRITMRGGNEQRVYSGTTKIFDDEAVFSTLPARAYIHRHTTGVTVLGSTSKTKYKLSAHPQTTRTANINTVTYVDANTITFIESTAIPIIGLGDILYWRLNVPVIPDATAETSIQPTLRVTGVAGTTITCKIYGDVDTTYSPASVDVYVRQFFNGTVSTGDTSNGSATVTNLSTPSNFQAGDWITFSNGALATPRKVASVNTAGASMVLHTTMNANIVGTQIYNTLLTAL